MQAAKRGASIWGSLSPCVKLPSRKSLFWLVPLFLLLLAANLRVFLTRGWEDSFFPTDYASLYYPLDAPSLRGWSVEPDHVLRLDLVWNKTPEAWRVLVDGKPTETIPGGNPLRIKVVGGLYDSASVPLSEFKHHYTLQPLPAGFGPNLEFTIYALSSEIYLKGGMRWPKGMVLYLVYTGLPVDQFTRRPVSAWVDDYSYIGAESLAAADRVVRDDMGVRDSDDTETRIEKVTRYLRMKLAVCGGIPKDDFRWMDPWHMYQEMIAGTGRGWCTQHAQIYTFFANRAGVPTRFVFGANTQKAVIVYTGHSWAESWVKEQNRWAFVDEDQSIIAVRDRKGALLNTAEILHLCEHDTFDGITARVFVPDGTVGVLKDWDEIELKVDAKPFTFATVPFASVCWLYKEEFGPQAIIKYREPPNVEDVRDIYSMLLKSGTFAWANFDRYLFHPNPAYTNLHTDAAQTYGVRRSLFFGWAVVSLLLVIAIFRKRLP